MAKKKGLSFYSRKKKISTSVVREVLTWCFGIFASIFLASVCTVYLGGTIRVVGESMEPALYNGQTVYVNKFVYLLSKPKKGDVVVFLPNGNQNAHYYVKRVLAVPGDHVVIKNNILFVNGIESPWVHVEIEDAGIAENDFYLGNGEYFCMGDDPNNSEDSRSPDIGPVKTKDMIGKVWFHGKCEELGWGFVK